MTLEVLPKSLINYLLKTDGSKVQCSLFSGMNKRDVWLIETQHARYIAKKTISHEINFYLHLRPLLQQTGIDVPLLFWHEIIDTIPWILIEYLPHPLPEERWFADAEILYYLQKIHSIDSKKCTALEAPYRPLWTLKDNDVLLQCLDPSDQKKTKPLLEQIFIEAQSFWNQQVFISGDANPRNWGMRLDGTLLEYDWQRAGIGPAAIDLATYMCTDESFASAMVVSQLYLKNINDTHPLSGMSYDTLARQIMISCVWNYVQFLADYMLQKKDVPETIIDHMADIFPNWIKQVAYDLRL